MMEGKTEGEKRRTGKGKGDGETRREKGRRRERLSVLPFHLMHFPIGSSTAYLGFDNRLT